MPKNNPHAYKNRNGGDGDDDKKKKKKSKRSKKAKKQLSRYDEHGVSRGTANARIRPSKRTKKMRKKSQSKAAANIARVTGGSPSSMHNGYSAEDNKKVSKPEFKRKKQNK